MCSKDITRGFLVTIHSIFVVLGLSGLGLGLFYVGNQSVLFLHIRVLLGDVPSSRAGFESSASHYESSNATTQYNHVLVTCLYTMTGTGGAILLVAGFGLWGTIKESRALLYVYCVLLVIIMMGEGVVGIGFYLYRTDVEEYIKGWMLTMIEEYYQGAILGANNTLVVFLGLNGLSEAVDSMQMRFQCCGVTNYTDFHSAHLWPRIYNYSSDGSTVSLSSVLVPVTCCKLANHDNLPYGFDRLRFKDLEGCLTTADPLSTNVQPCYTYLKDEIVGYSDIFLGVSAGILVLQLFGLLASCCLIRTKEDYAYVNNEDKGNCEF